MADILMFHTDTYEVKFFACPDCDKFDGVFINSVESDQSLQDELSDLVYLKDPTPGNHYFLKELSRRDFIERIRNGATFVECGFFVQRQGMEYEFDLYGSMDHSHVLTITKSRCPAVDGAVVVKPGDGFLLPVINWLETGESTPAVEVVKVERADEETIQSLVGRAANAGITPEKLIEQLPRLARVTELSHLLADQIKAIEQWIDGEARRKAMAAGSGAKKQASPRGRAAAARAMVPSTEDQLDAMMGGDGDASESQPDNRGCCAC